MIAQGTAKEIMANPNSITGKVLIWRRKKSKFRKNEPQLDKSKLLKLKGATGNNLKGVNLEIPVGLFTCITGVSGSGKSTLINDTLFPLAQNALNRAEKRILRLINPLKAWNISTK